MNGMKAFFVRNRKELLRDPLSYLFCIGFPLVMLVVMTFVNESIPPQANMTVFQIQNLTPGIMVFGSCFVMLFAALLVSKDKSSALLLRLYASPLRGIDFVLGYTLVLLLVAVAQAAFLLFCGGIIAAIQGTAFSFSGCAAAFLCALPVELLMIGLGILLGTAFSDKAAPGVSSVFISLSSILGGVFMDIEGLGGGWKTVCTILPFYPGVKALRAALNGGEGLGNALLEVSGYAALIFGAAVLCFSAKRKRDLK